MLFDCLLDMLIPLSSRMEVVIISAKWTTSNTTHEVESNFTNELDELDYENTMSLIKQSEENLN